MLPPADRVKYELSVALARSGLISAEFNAAWSQGEHMSLMEVLTYVDSAP